jgi:presequence protease
LKAKLSKKKLEEIVKQTLNLQKYHSEPEKEEDLNKIPHLSVKDLDKDIEKIPLEIQEISSVKLLSTPIFTNNICYLSLAFDARVVPFDELQNLTLLSMLLGSVDTKKHSYVELGILVQKYTGGIHSRIGNFALDKVEGEYDIKMFFSGSSLMNNVVKLRELMGEIMLESKFDDKDHIKETLKDWKAWIGSMLERDSHKFVFRRLRSYFSSKGSYDEYTQGLTFYHFLCDLLDDFDNRWEGLRSSLLKLQKLVFNKKKLLVHATCEKEHYSKVKKQVQYLLDNLAEEDHKRLEYEFENKVKNEGLASQSQVQYVVQGYDFKLLGYKFSGVMRVLASLLDKEYLFQKIRVEGGAYGFSVNISRSGEVFLGSYRDPNLKETLEVFSKISQFLNNLSMKNVDKYIIGTIGSLDMPLTPASKGGIAFFRYLAGIKEADLQKERDEVLKSSLADIKGYSKLFEGIIEKNYYCVLGNEAKIRKESNLFEKIVPVTKSHETKK